MKEWMFREEVDFLGCSVDLFPWGKGVILLPATSLIKNKKKSTAGRSKEGGGGRGYLAGFTEGTDHFSTKSTPYG